MDCTKTLRLRIKDKHAKVLCQVAREVNQVWNHINAVSAKAARPFHGKPRFLSGYDLQKFTAGFSKCDGVSVGSGTVQLVCVEYATRRKQFKKTRLNWRVSNPKSSKYSLGWIPFKGGHAKYKAGQIHFAGQKFSLWDSYGLADYELRTGSFSQDSRGRWYFNVAVQIQGKPSAGTAAVGIDLGLKECATVSTGDKLEGRWYRSHEKALAIAQRAKKKKRVKVIHAQIKNQRKDALHQFSTQLVIGQAVAVPETEFLPSKVNLPGLVFGVPTFEWNPAQRIFAGFRIADTPIQSRFFELFAPRGVFHAHQLHGAAAHAHAVAFAEPRRIPLQVVA